ncbi:hypothetical protein H9W91_07330 [Streptomyces alfalfae]|uniref:hypothetical protein n=1 Tax=Streptomyces alfalfae TaxID=1642299 RepID=UPI001BA47E67|nr:hypothetical protein [Streptomyces alfalfae]QUI30691.1 hypothetical protein H9W91_07330 [Streptomyces alfalfae]
MTLPKMRTWSAREVVTDAMLNEQIRDVNAYLSDPPWFECGITGSKAITGGAVTSFVWDAASANGFKINKNSAGRVASLTVQEPGLYRVHLALAGKFDPAPSHIFSYVRLNGAYGLRGSTTTDSPSYADTSNADGLLVLKSGDILTTQVYATNGRTGSIGSTSGEVIVTKFIANWVGVA